jgi:hypothetical protein
MQFRIYGLVMFGTAVLILWYFTPAQNGTRRYPQRLQNRLDMPVALIVVVLIGLALPFMFFGAPGHSILGNSAP